MSIGLIWIKPNHIISDFKGIHLRGALSPLNMLPSFNTIFFTDYEFEIIFFKTVTPDPTKTIFILSLRPSQWWNVHSQGDGTSHRIVGTFVIEVIEHNIKVVELMASRCGSIILTLLHIGVQITYSSSGWAIIAHPTIRHLLKIF